MSAARHGIAGVDCLEGYAAFDGIVDVRTPAEFAEDHIPNSINCPVLDNTQRIEVGTLYKQDSPFAAKKIGAAYVAENIALHLRTSFRERPKNWRPLIVCWRGGQRSGAMTLILRRVGWDAQQLEGGYKSYRKQVVEALAAVPRRLEYVVVCGATGSGKSRILQALARQGQQVLDLEDLARHKGSVLGVLPDAPQPSQKMFESQLLTALRSFDPARPVFVEAESRKIGSVQLPDALLESMRRSRCVNIAATREARIEFLLRDYDYFLHAPEWLNSRLDVLTRLHSHEVIRRWQAYTAEARWPELVGELLELHYDPHYLRSQSRNFRAFDATSSLTTDDLSPPAIERLAAELSRRQQCK